MKVLIGTPEEIHAYESLHKSQSVEVRPVKEDKATELVQKWLEEPYAKAVTKWIADMRNKGFTFETTDGQCRLRIYRSLSSRALAYVYIGGTLRVDVHLSPDMGKKFPNARVKPSATTGYWLETSLLDAEKRELATAMIEESARRTK